MPLYGPFPVRPAVCGAQGWNAVAWRPLQRYRRALPATLAAM